MWQVVGVFVSKLREEWRVASLDRRWRVVAAVGMLTLSMVLRDPAASVLLFMTGVFVRLYLWEVES